MATPSVLAFDAEGRAIDFDVWVDDLQLFLQCDRADGLSLFDLTSGASPAPTADADATVRSQWATRDAAARLAVRRQLPTSERAQFSQYKSAQTLYDAVVARYSSPTTAALSRLLLPYLFPDLAAFSTVADLITHLCTSDTRYRAALPADFCAKNPPPHGPLPLSLSHHSQSVAVGAEVSEVAAVEAAAEAAVVAEAAEAAEAAGVAVELVAGLRRGVVSVVVRATSSSAVVRPCPLSSSAGVAIYDLDFDAILSAMYAVSISDEGDCYRCFPPDPGIETAALGTDEAAALGACDAAALGASASASSGTGEFALSGTASASASLTFTLDSGASRSFFRDRTTLTPLRRPVAVSLADPSGGPVLSHFSTVLPCPAAPSGTLSGLYLPSFSTNLVSGADLQDGGVHQFTPACQRVTHCTKASIGRHLATFTRQPGSSLYTLTTPSPPVAESGRVAASGQVFAAASRSGPESAPCSCRLLSHETLLWHHRLGHPSLLRLRGMASRLLVSGLPRGGEFSSALLGAYCRARGIRQTFTLPDSLQQNGIAERRIGMVMDVARTSMMHAAAPHFLWPFAVRYAAHQINLHPRVSRPETSPALLWTGKVGDASAFRVWGSRAFVRDLSADKLSPRAAPCVFLGFPPNAPGWQFYHPTSRRVLSSQDVT
ncbi:unnamed protein product, partial [Closterium sp. NIES-53]